MYVIDIIRTIAFFALLFVCSYTDFKKGKIYNKHLLMGIVGFVIIYLLEYVIFLIIDRTNTSFINEKIIDNFLGFLIGFVIGFVFYLLGIFKGGDAKLLSVVGLYIGKHQVFNHFVIIIIVAGIGALYVLIRNKIFIKRFKRIFLYFRGLFLTGHFEKYTTDDDGIKFPFAVYVLIGEIFSYLFYYLRG